jgi:hypothetical protein
MVATHLNIDADVEEATSRVTVMNAGILKRSVGIGANAFPKTYKVKGTWTVWALVLVGLIAVISPKIIVPLVMGREVWSVSLWNGFYQPFIALYACLVCFLLGFKIPYGLVREPDAFIVEFLCRKIRIELSDLDEVRVVRKWKIQDSAKQIVDAAPEFVGPCIGAQGKGYEEVGAPKQRLKAVPFSFCDPCSCTGAKIYWGAPGKSREVCIISLKNSTYGNYMLDLRNLDGFIRDNRADYSNVTPKNGVPPQILGVKSMDEKKCVLASPASTTASASPLSSLASPMSDFASPVAGVAHPLFTVGASGMATQFETLAEELSSGEESPRDSDDAHNSI